MGDVTDAPKFSLALEEGRRGLDQQLRDLDGMRGRAVNALGIGGLLGTFYGGLTAATKPPAPGTDPGVAAWLVIAAVAFGVVVVASLAILWPRRIDAVQDPKKIVKWATDGHDRDAMERKLAEHLGDTYEKNRRRIDWLMRAYTLALFALGAEVGALALQLRSAWT
jgi:hypothetical protein